jgi:rod shape-determining protein MreD
MSGLLPDIGLEPGAPLRIGVVPTLSVMIASAISAMPLIASAPLLPPLGLMVFLAWRLMRSDMWPIWIGLPLGLWDDLLSGQPVGSAVALWTIVMLGMDALDRRLVWRGFNLDWIIGGFALAFVLVGGAVLARSVDIAALPALIGPQLLWSWLLLPVVMLLVARLDDWRLAR